MKVIVEIAEVHKSIRVIEVPDDASPQKIRELAAENAGNANELDLQYSHTLDPQDWIIRTEDGNYFP